MLQLLINDDNDIIIFLVAIEVIGSYPDVGIQAWRRDFYCRCECAVSDAEGSNN